MVVTFQEIHDLWNLQSLSIFVYIEVTFYKYPSILLSRSSLKNKGNIYSFTDKLSMPCYHTLLTLVTL